MASKSHEKHIAEQCVKNVRKSWGNDARQRLGQTLFNALVCQEIVSVVRMQCLDLLDEKGKASAAEYMQEVANLALNLADPQEA